MALAPARRLGTRQNSSERIYCLDMMRGRSLADEELDGQVDIGVPADVGVKRFQ